MIDIQDVDFYDYEGLGYMIDPLSDTKTVVIPSPPTKMVVKTNPRPAVIYITNEIIDESFASLDNLKAFCKENKVVFACPKGRDEESVGKTYKHLVSKAKAVNIVADKISVKCDSGSADFARAVVDYIIDELDGDLEDAEKFEF